MMAETKHRKLLLQVLQRLSFEDTASLIYLSGNIVGLPVDSSRAMLQGIKLFAELEGRGMVGDGNYTFVTECLEAIGRNDLVAMIVKSTAHQLLHVPPSFQASGQMMLMKQAAFKAKYSQFCMQLSHLVSEMNNRQLLENGFEELNGAVQSGCFSALRNLSHALHKTRLDIGMHLAPGALKSGLLAMSFFWKALSNTLMSLDKSEQTLPLMQQCHSHFAHFEQILLSSPWLGSAAQQELVSACSYRPECCDLQPLWSVAHSTHAIFSDAISVVANNQAIADSSKELEQALHILESMTAKALCSKSRILTTWLLSLLHHPQAGEISGEIMDMITSLLEEHKQEMRKQHHLLAKAVGTELLHRIGLVQLSDQAADLHSHPEPTEIDTPGSACRLALTDCRTLLWHATLLVLFGFVANVPYNHSFAENLETIVNEQFVCHRGHLQSEYIRHSEAVGVLVKEAFARSKECVIEHLLRDIQDQKASVRQTMHQLLDYEEELEQTSSDLSKSLN